ncbi:MAG: rhodanese-like domain-containing protein [Bacteroidota bacterium]
MKDYFKKLNSLIAILLIALSLTFVGCSDDDDDNGPTKTEAELLLEYLETTGGDFINTQAPTIINAIDVYNKNLATPDKIKIIDVRSKADYDNGHIKNAVNVLIPNLYDYFKTNATNLATYEDVVLVCYTGQSAAYSASLLRLLGYSNVKSMKFGMSAWHDDFATTYKNTIANGNSRATQFVQTETPKPTTKNPLPTLNTGKKTGKEILEERVKYLFGKGWASGLGVDATGISHTDVFNNLNNLFIINYWPAAHYLDPGHIPGAMQYTPKESLKSTKDLLTLPTNKQIVVYCYTGQTSAYVIAFLRVLGYDAKSLLFGTSGMIYDKVKEKGLTAFDPTRDIINKDYEKP